MVTRLIPLDNRGDMIGRLLARLLPLLPRIQNRAMTNIARAFPDLPEADRLKIAKGAAFNVGKTLTEVLNMDQFKKNPPKYNVSGPGLDVLKHALAKGQGVVIASAHFGQWEAIRYVIRDLGAEVGAVYRPNNNPFYEKRFFWAMSLAGGPLYAKGTDQVKDMVRYAAEGGVIAILADQRYRQGALVPFFGHDAWTSPAPAAIAMRLKIPLLTIYGVRGSDGIDVVFEDPIPHSDPITMTNAVHASLEAQIMQNPDQWYWFHDRWALVPKSSSDEVAV